MIAYIFNGLDKVSDNYHTEGGVVIIAQDRAEAERLTEHTKVELEWDCLVGEYLLDEIVSAPQPKMYVFPDAGCC